MEKATANRQLLKHKADTLSEPEAAEVLEYIGVMEFFRDDHSDALTETIAKLLCEAMIGAQGSHRSQARRDPPGN